MIKRAHRGATLALVALAVALCLAACGSSSSGSSGSSGSGSSASAAGTGTSGSGTSTTARSGQYAKLASCLKQHGVTLPSRPAGASGPGGYGPPGGSAGGAPAGGAPSGTGTGTTGTSTTRRRFGGGFLRGNPKLAAAMTACRKQLGLPATGGFGGGAPGGRTQISAATLAKFSACMKKNGVTLKQNKSGKGGIFSRAAMSNPKFQTAFKACRSTLGNAFAHPSGAGAGTSGAGAGTSSSAASS